jgi:hypothetical protein
LIRINDGYPAPADNASDSREVIMSFDTMLVSAAVISVFVAFAAVLLWGDFQTRPSRLRADAQSQKRGSS